MTFPPRSASRSAITSLFSRTASINGVNPVSCENTKRCHFYRHYTVCIIGYISLSTLSAWVCRAYNYVLFALVMYLGQPMGRITDLYKYLDSGSRGFLLRVYRHYFDHRPHAHCVDVPPLRKRMHIVVCLVRIFFKGPKAGPLLSSVR